MIQLIQGTPGSGKSAVALLLGIEHLMNGGVLATNFDLVPDWSNKLAKMNLFCRLGLRDPLVVAQDYYERVYKIGQPHTLYELAKKVPELVKKRVKKQREGKALVILDEAQLYFNSRNWKDNMGFIEYFTQHRKLQFDVILVAHHLEMIDKQVRPLIEIESFFRNMKMVRIPVIGLSATLGMNLFFVVRKYSGRGPGRGLHHSFDSYSLNKKISNLYDTLEIFGFNKLPDKLTHQGNPPQKVLIKKPTKKYRPSKEVKGYYESDSSCPPARGNMRKNEYIPSFNI